MMASNEHALKTCLCDFCRISMKVNPLPKHYLDPVVKGIHDAKDSASIMDINDCSSCSDHTIEANFTVKVQMFRYCKAYIGEDEINALKSESCLSPFFPKFNKAKELLQAAYELGVDPRKINGYICLEFGMTQYPVQDKDVPDLSGLSKFEKAMYHHKF